MTLDGLISNYEKSMKKRAYFEEEKIKKVCVLYPPFNNLEGELNELKSIESSMPDDFGEARKVKVNNLKIKVLSPRRINRDYER